MRRLRLDRNSVACNIVARRRDLPLESPTVAVAVEGYLAFAASAAGKTPAVLPNRSAAFARAQRSARKPISYEDLVGMAIAGDADSRRALLALLDPLLTRLEADTTGSGMNLGEAVADFAEHTAGVPGAFMRGEDPHRILWLLSEVDAKSRVLRNVLRASEEATRPRRLRACA